MNRVIDQSTYVDNAEKVIKKLNESRNRLTTTQIRNLLAMSAEIYNSIMNQEDCDIEGIIAKVDYLRMRCAYESGREASVKAFVVEAKLLEALKFIKDNQANIDVRKEFILFNHYFEALVAYHKFHGGQD